MPDSRSSQNILAQAKIEERKFDWLRAIDLYEKMVTSKLHESGHFVAGEIQESIWRCLVLAIFQAETRCEFRKQLKTAIEWLDKTTRLLCKSRRKADSTLKLALNRARTNYLRYFLSTNPNARRKMLDSCLKSMKEVLTACSKDKDKTAYGKASVETATYLIDRLDLELDTQIRVRLFEEALQLGENAVGVFSQTGRKQELAEALYIAAVLYYNGALSIPTNKARCEQKASDYAKEAIKTSEKTGGKLLLGRATVLLGLFEQDLGGGPEAASELFRRAIKYGTETKDKRIIAEAFDGLALSTYWIMAAEEDIEKMREKSKRCEEYAGRAIECGLSTDYPSLIPHSLSYGYCANFSALARRETEPESRRRLLEKTVAIARQGLKLAERLGATHTCIHVSLELAQALYQLSILKTGPEKRRILEEGSALEEKTLFATEQLRPNFPWPRVLAYETSALVTSELSRLEENTEKRKKLLEKSVALMESCVANFQKYVFSRVYRREYFVLLGRFQSELGSILGDFYKTTNKRDVLEKIVQSYRNAVQMEEKAEMVTWIAEAYWQIAKAYDQLSEYSESAENFALAAGSYKLAATKLPELGIFYADYSLYMQAWSEIETARRYHSSNEYGKARKHYDKASKLHKSTKAWAYLAPNYLAWAQLEHGEDLSRDERSQEAMQAFRKAADLFSETRKTLEASSSQVMGMDELDLIERLMEASEVRKTYCFGRIALEEAKSWDRQGEHDSSSKKYGQAADEFRKAADTMESDSDPQEFKPIISLCQAWQMMARAEAEASPDFFLEASRLFDRAKVESLNEEAKMLALGHSSFCQALAAGTEFERTRDQELYSAATQHLASSANYYLRAGFETASEYAKATQRLFDAYVYMDTAKKEIDPERKAKYYIMAEKVLQTSVDSYARARHVEKSEKARKLLESVREERQLAMSLTEILGVPRITSSTTSFTLPSQTHEEAVGLERFEHASIQADLMAQSKTAVIAEDFSVQVQIANVGKEAVLLACIKGLLPAGFEVVRKPDYYDLENSDLDMKGKRLDPLKTEEVGLVLRSFDRGTFKISPRIIYIDEKGNKMTYELEPMIIRVVETALPERTITGYEKLDELLLGGLPRNYAVVLTSRSCDEKDRLVRRFLETGIERNEATFYIAINPDDTRDLAINSPTSFHLFVSNPQADAIIKNAPNIIKLRGVENLTDINIALTLAIRKLDPSMKGPRRVCIDIISDVLLRHHAVQTRRWLTSLMTELKSTGFTTLAAFDPEMHSSQDARAILDLFDGEISIYGKETGEDSGRFLKIKKMSNQKYLGDELPLGKEDAG